MIALAILSAVFIALGVCAELKSRQWQRAEETAHRASIAHHCAVGLLLIAAILAGWSVA